MQVTNGKLGPLILDDIAAVNHKDDLHRIIPWIGPKFDKLLQETQNEKVKFNSTASKLDVILDFKAYRKRCMNDQQEWFKKNDAAFFAQSLRRIYQVWSIRFIFILFLEFCDLYFHRDSKIRYQRQNR